jgi:hypothetical protein
MRSKFLVTFIICIFAFTFGCETKTPSDNSQSKDSNKSQQVRNSPSESGYTPPDPEKWVGLSKFFFNYTKSINNFQGYPIFPVAINEDVGNIHFDYSTDIELPRYGRCFPDQEQISIKLALEGAKFLRRPPPKGDPGEDTPINEEDGSISENTGDIYDIHPDDVVVEHIVDCVRGKDFYFYIETAGNREDPQIEVFTDAMDWSEESSRTTEP